MPKMVRKYPVQISPGDYIVSARFYVNSIALDRKRNGYWFKGENRLAGYFVHSDATVRVVIPNGS